MTAHRTKPSATYATEKVFTIEQGGVKTRMSPRTFNGGILGVAAAINEFGPRIATIGEIHPFMVHGKQQDDQGPFGATAIGRTHTVFVRAPLEEELVKDGRYQYIVSEITSGKSRGEWRFPITQKFLNENHIGLSDSGLLFVVDSFGLRQEGKLSFTTTVRNPMQDLRVGPAKEDLTGQLTALFGADMKNFHVGDFTGPYGESRVKIGSSKIGFVSDGHYKWEQEPDVSDSESGYRYGGIQINGALPASFVMLIKQA